MPLFTDQVGRTIELNGIPQRIVSLVPSQTELLADLGLDETVQGITKFCIHPRDWFQQKKRVGGTKTIHLDAVDQIQPDLIIANKEENLQEQIESLATKYNVWISDVHDLSSGIDMIRTVGHIVQKENAADRIIQQIENNFRQLRPLDPPIKTAYLIWNDPYMTIGGDTFIHDMLSRCGFGNIFAAQDRYPTIAIEDIRRLNCELLLLSSEPFPFKPKHADLLQQQLPQTKIIIVDGEMFSWYGSRLMQATSYFKTLIGEVESFRL